jgi:hypothetical protein
VSAERDILARAEDLADTADLAETCAAVIGSARAARVDQGALGGLVTAARLLGADVSAVLSAARGRHAGFGRDTGLLEAADDLAGDIEDRAAVAARLRIQASSALARARADEAAACGRLAAARLMPVSRPCRGCHAAREAAIDAARADRDDARERARNAAAAAAVLAALKLDQALAAVRRVPEDLRETYAAAYDLVTADPNAMPKDGDFITGTAAAMAAELLAARTRAVVPARAAVQPPLTKEEPVP